MKRIGLLSDTHGHMDARIIEHLAVCDEIWHAGDIGTIECYKILAELKPFRAVSGNIDGQEIKSQASLIQRFYCEEVDVLIKHIVGYPDHYDYSVIPVLKSSPPKLLIAGHSHILKIMFDRKNNLLFVNPGASGRNGFHLMRTLVRFTIEGPDVKDMEVVELGKRT